jgi:pSer/pThr/pTyr-binding forkhead associated (FHA) protein
MRDGYTQKLKTRSPESSTHAFLRKHVVRLVSVSGHDAGAEFVLDHERMTMGRGPGVDFVIGDPALSRQHLAFELVGNGFRVEDLGSTNGLRVNGNRVHARDLAAGDRIEAGAHIFQLVIDERQEAPETYDLTPES